MGTSTAVPSSYSAYYGPIRWAEHPQKCFAVHDGLTNSGTKIYLWDCLVFGMHSNLQFASSVGGSGPIRWLTHPTRCISVCDDVLGAVQYICLEECGASSGHRVKSSFTMPVRAGSGPIRWSANPQKCIAVEGEGMANGNKLVLQECGDGLHRALQFIDHRSPLVDGAQIVTTKQEHEVVVDLKATEIAGHPIHRSARLPCWGETDSFDHDRCCGNPPATTCFKKDSPYTEVECCSTGYSLIDPLAGLPLPGDDMSRKMQARWESVVHHSSPATTCCIDPTSLGDFRFNGSMSSCDHSGRFNISLRRFKIMDAMETPCSSLGNDTYGFFEDYISGVPAFGAGDVIIDVGANLGRISILLAKMFPHARVIALEPNPVAFRYLRWNIRVNGVQRNVEVVHGGLWSTSGTHMEIPVCPGWGFPSPCATVAGRILPLRPGGNPGGQMAHVRTFTLPDLMAERGISRIALLKLDCEGCESVLRASPDWPSLASRVGRLVGEFHARDGVWVDFRNLEEFDSLWRREQRYGLG